MKYTAPRGTKDILPDETPFWQQVEGVCREVFELYNYKEIRTPIFEATELFRRSIGEGTDIVKKEMYTFLDRKGRSLTLRPEETAPVVRACLENNLISPDQLTKLYYLGPMFRYERPQAGRQRQFHQAGVEVFGSSDPLLDVEVIQLGMIIFCKLGLRDLEVDVNSVGCQSCKPGYRDVIRSYFEKHVASMCNDCKERIALNPLRILDCKEPPCQKYIAQAPAAVSYLCTECKNHFDEVIGGLERLRIGYRINDRLVRGLDYYTRTTFEVVSKRLGAQNAICGGGRYDKLVEELGGKPTPAVGFAVGLERVVEVMKESKVEIKKVRGVTLFIATIGEKAKRVGFDLLMRVREKEISADMDYIGKSLKAQMKIADRLEAEFVGILGEEELNKGVVVIRNMKTAEQKEISLKEAMERIENYLGKG